MMHYDWYNRSGREKMRYNEVVTTLFTSLERRGKPVKAVYDKSNNSVVISYGGLLNFRGGETLFAYYKLDSLALNVSGIFALDSLDGLTTKELNLKGCERFKMNEEIIVNGLKVLKIKRNHRAKSYRRFIRSENSYKIQNK